MLEDVLRHAEKEYVQPPPHTDILVKLQEHCWEDYIEFVILIGRKDNY